MTKCKECGCEFKKSRMSQYVCSYTCAIAYTKKTQEKAKLKKEKQKLKEDRERIKSRSEHLKDAQAIFNKFIRLRDEKEPCISCQKHHSGQYHAGHYRSVGSCPQLRFEELNVHKQCSVCNNYLSGNLINYRINLIKKIGLTEVEKIEGKHEAKKYTLEQIKEIKKIYKQKIKEL